jgi:hypothetical protein
LKEIKIIIEEVQRLVKRRSDNDRKVSILLRQGEQVVSY